MHPSSTRSQTLGLAAGAAVAMLGLAYAVVLTVGLLSLPSADQPIQDPWFTMMELLIIGIAPAMVAYTAALHAWVPPDRQAIALLGVVFMGMCAVITCSVHFSVLFLSHEAAFAGHAWSRLVFAFTWPSVAYALDILAWDVFFPLAALFAALSIEGEGLVIHVRRLLYASAALAFLGMLGVPLANMNVRNAGIVGYAAIFPMAAALSAVVFHRASGRRAA